MNIKHVIVTLCEGYFYYTHSVRHDRKPKANELEHNFKKRNINSKTPKHKINTKHPLYEVTRWNSLTENNPCLCDTVHSPDQSILSTASRHCIETADFNFITYS